MLGYVLKEERTVKEVESRVTLYVAGVYVVLALVTFLLSGVVGFYASMGGETTPYPLWKTFTALWILGPSLILCAVVALVLHKIGSRRIARIVLAAPWVIMLAVAVLP